MADSAAAFNNNLLKMTNLTLFAFFCSLYKFRTWEIKIKSLNTLIIEKRLFVSIYIQKSNNIIQKISNVKYL